MGCLDDDLDFDYAILTYREAIAKAYRESFGKSAREVKDILTRDPQLKNNPYYTEERIQSDITFLLGIGILD